jgi:DNA polymerase-3 subunit gamma/tau
MAARGGLALSAGPYRALYRAWRPRRFADVLGQEHVTRTLRNAVRDGRPAHAYLFCGPRGTGKTSVARILAQSLNCLHPGDGEPCGACPVCLQVAEERFLDIVEIDAASNRGIDEIRELRESVQYAPGSGRCKVYIVDEVHMLTDPAWNAFLKTLEEPPAGTVFILATTDPHRVPLTALSRCQRFDFRPLGPALIAERLAAICAQEGAQVSPGAIDAIARRAEGGMRDAISVLDQVLAFGDRSVEEADVAQILGVADQEALDRLMAAMDRRDAAALLAALDACQDEGKDLLRLARDLMGAFRDRLVASLSTGTGAPGEAEAAMAAIEGLAAAETAMRRSGQPRLLLDVALLRLLQAPAGAAAGAGGNAGRPVAEAGGPPPAHPVQRTARSAVGPVAPVRAAAGRPPSEQPQPPAARPVAVPPAKPPALTEASGRTGGVESGPADGATPHPRAGAPGSEASAPPAHPERRELTLQAILDSWDGWVAAASPLVRDMLGRCRPLSLAGRKVTIETEAGHAHFAPKLKPVLDRAVRRDFGLGLVFEFVERAAPAEPGSGQPAEPSPSPSAAAAGGGGAARSAPVRPEGSAGPQAGAGAGAGAAARPAPVSADRSRPPAGERSLVAEVLDVFGGGEVLSEEGGSAS